MTDPALAYTRATELARRIRAKEISPIELIDNALARREPRRLLCLLIPRSIDKDPWYEVPVQHDLAMSRADRADGILGG